MCHYGPRQQPRPIGIPPWLGGLSNPGSLVAIGLRAGDPCPTGISPTGGGISTLGSIVHAITLSLIICTVLQLQYCTVLATAPHLWQCHSGWLRTPLAHCWFVIACSGQGPIPPTPYAATRLRPTKYQLLVGGRRQLAMPPALQPGSQHPCR